MNPREEVEAFEAGKVDPEAFRHRHHVEMAWNYIQCMPLPEAIARYGAALQAMATSVGRGDRFHETITWAFMLIVNERIQRGRWVDYDDLVAANPDLLAWPNSVLDHYYKPDTLKTELARTSFVMPDAAGGFHNAS